MILTRRTFYVAIQYLQICTRPILQTEMTKGAAYNKWVLVQRRKELVHTLQERQKWTTKKRNFKINDIVLLNEDPSINQWPLCKFIKTNPDDQGIVRSVTLLLGIDDNNNRERILECPISKLVLILEANDIDSPTKGS